MKSVAKMWLRSYRPEELFDAQGRPVELILAQAPTGELRMGANPRANGGLGSHDLTLPDYRELDDLVLGR